MLTQSRPQQVAPVALRTVPARRRHRITRAAAIATACMAVGTATVVIADDQPAPQVRSIAEPSQPVATRYHDIEANKAARMRALSRHIAEQQANRTVTQSAARAQERYYSSYGEPQPIDGATAAARAQERYYSSYGEREPLTLPQSPSPSDDTPWLPIALSIAIALVIVTASATHLRRLRIRRRRAARAAT
jgi:hypothetical protein